MKITFVHIYSIHSTQPQKMAKFKVLQNNRRFMSSIFRIDVEQKNNRWLIPFLLISLILFSTLLSNVVRMCNNSYDFPTRMVAFCMFILMSQPIIILFEVGVSIQKIVALYRTLQVIADSDGMDFDFETLQNTYEYILNH